MKTIPIRDFITKKEGYVQEFDGIDLTNTTWVFGNELPRYATTSRTFNINFNSGDNEFTQIYSRDDYIGMCDLIYNKADGTAYTVLDYHYESGGYYTLNYGEAYKKIHITGGSDVIDSSLISWLQSCATFVPKTLYTYNIEVAGTNSYGEGPKTAMELNLTGIPFTIDTEEVSITDINGIPLTEILSCGQTIIATVNVDNKQLSDNIVIDNIAEFECVISDDKESAIITIKGIKGDINFIFGELLEKIKTFTVVDNTQLTTIGTYSTTTSSWYEFVNTSNDFTIEDDCVYYYGPDRIQYSLRKDKKSVSATSEIQDKDIYVSMYTGNSYLVRISGYGGTIDTISGDDGPITWETLVNNNSSKFVVDDGGNISYLYQGVTYALYHVWTGESVHISHIVGSEGFDIG